MRVTFSGVGAAVLLLVASGVSAQSWPSYAVKILPAVKSSTGLAQRTFAYALNGKGDVVGWTVKPAGTVSEATTSSTGWGLFPPINFFTGTTRVPAFEVYPVVWSGTTIKVLTRPSGLYNAMGRAIGDDGTVLMAVADAAGKTKSADGLPSSVAGMHMRIWQGGRYTIPTLQSKRLLAQQPQFLGLDYSAPGGRFVINSHDENYPPVVWQGGAVSLFQPTNGGNAAPSFQYTTLMRVWGDGRGWISAAVGRPEFPTRYEADYSCLVGPSGQMSVVPEPAGVDDFECLAMNSSGAVFGRTSVRVPVEGLEGFPYRTELGGYYLIKDGQPQRVDVKEYVAEPSWLDEQGRVFYQTGAGLFDDWNNTVYVHSNGVSRPITQLLKTSVGAAKKILMLDMNDKGQVLVQIGRGGTNFEYAVLTPQ
jgi:hypothetical protein